MNSKSGSLFKIPHKSLFLIFIILAVLIIAYTVIALNQSKKEMLHLMNEQAHSLIETTLSASHTALLSYEEIEYELRLRLLNNANLIKLLLEQKSINNKLLSQIADQNNIFRINIFNSNGEKIFTNHLQTHTDLEPKFSPFDFLEPIFTNQIDTLFLGIKQARFEEGYRFAVAIAAEDRSAIVLNLDAEKLLEFRRNIGFGALLKKVTENNGITYAILQDTTGIIAAAGKLIELKSISDDPFLNNAINSMEINTRVISTSSANVFEAVHQFSYDGEIIGLLRLGVPADPLLNITKSNEHRLLLMGAILLILGSILLAYVFTKQNFEVLKKDYKIIEDYSNKIIQNVSDCVIVIDKGKNIKIFNRAAELLFGIDSRNVIGHGFQSFLGDEIMKNLLDSGSEIESVEIKIGGIKKSLLVSSSTFLAENDHENRIIVIKDLTKMKMIEDQMNRKERMVAMGELASGVAHEIRNPLNTISTITQQLNKDFEPNANAEEFYSLTKLVNKEILRINETIKDFLRFSKPEKINRVEFKLSDLLNQIDEQYRSMFDEKNIEFRKSYNWDGFVNWDRKQIQQVLMNLFQNSFDSIEQDGHISMIIDKQNESISIKVIDDGIGIPQHLLNKIFNLYFTTKAEGTGIGLSIVQRIVYEHNGTMDIESKEKFGTTFMLSIPINTILE